MFEPNLERLKLLYSAYDLSGVAPSEERRKSSQSSGGSSLSGGNSTAGGGGGGGGGGKAKPSRRSKYLTLEDITAVLASASQAAAYPALLSFTTDGKGGMTTGHLSGGGVIGGGGGGGTGGDGMFCCSCCWCCTGCNGDGCSGGAGAGGRGGGGGGGGDNDRGWCGGGECKGGAEKSPRNGGEGGLPSKEDSLRDSEEGKKEACGGRGGGSSSSSSSCSSGRSSRRGCSARVSRDPEALAELLREMAQRNAERYAAAAVSEFGQAQGGAGLTQKEFERWALTGPVLRCRINEFSIDLNLAPFRGVRLW
ncbi:unnamed protein product [Ectocarpus sp. CCAP 1310/34]|nr:unnamed protein product [Ectocarpus sp. CCAP 1310/34]